MSTRKEIVYEQVSKISSIRSTPLFPFIAHPMGPINSKKEPVGRAITPEVRQTLRRMVHQVFEREWDRQKLDAIEPLTDTPKPGDLRDARRHNEVMLRPPIRSKNPVPRGNPVQSYGLVNFSLQDVTYQIDLDKSKVYRRFIEVEKSRTDSIIAVYRSSVEQGVVAKPPPKGLSRQGKNRIPPRHHPSR